MLPILVFGALACVQAMLLALALVFAQSTVDRVARGVDAQRAVRAMPRGWRSHVRIQRRGDVVRVELQAPLVVPGAGRFAKVSASSERA